MPKQPTPEQMATLMNHPGDGPVVMINVLRFAPGDAAAEYAKYGEEVSKILQRIGAKQIYAGTFDSTVIGDFEETFDAVALVQYPSRKAFFEMIASEEYQAIHPHRDRGLESQWLIASTPIDRIG